MWVEVGHDPRCRQRESGLTSQVHSGGLLYPGKLREVPRG